MYLINKSITMISSNQGFAICYIQRILLLDVQQMNQVRLWKCYKPEFRSSLAPSINWRSSFLSTLMEASKVIRKSEIDIKLAFKTME
jgi:hypothetical protein